MWPKLWSPLSYHAYNLLSVLACELVEYYAILLHISIVVIPELYPIATCNGEHVKLASRDMYINKQM